MKWGEMGEMGGDRDKEKKGREGEKEGERETVYVCGCMFVSTPSHQSLLLQSPDAVQIFQDVVTAYEVGGFRGSNMSVARKQEGL